MINLTKLTKLLLILFSFTLLFSGCSKLPDCSTQDTTYEKYTLNEQTSQCELSQKIEKDICGNGIAEASNDENYCNCPKDVSKTHPKLGCDGTKGDYLEKTCSDQNKCELMQNSKVISQKKTIDMEEDYLHFKADITLNSPFIQNTIDENKMNFDLSLYNMNTYDTIKLKDIVVTELNIIDNLGFNIARVTYNEKIDTVGQKLQAKQIELSPINEYQKITPFTFKLGIKYAENIVDDEGVLVETKNQIKELEGYLDDWTILNPEFTEE